MTDPTMVVWHRTTKDCAAGIESGGFRDGYGSYGLAGGAPAPWTWVSDVILNVNEGTPDGYAIYRIEVATAAFEASEWVQDIGYRESLIPAEILNSYPRQLGAECFECSKWMPCPLEKIPAPVHEFPYPVENIVVCGECSGLGGRP